MNISTAVMCVYGFHLFHFLFGSIIIKQTTGKKMEEISTTTEKRTIPSRREEEREGHGECWSLAFVRLVLYVGQREPKGRR